MSEAPEDAKPRLTGEAQWKAELNATEQRNAAAKRKAHEHESPMDVAISQRERRLAVAEVAQLEALNKKIAKRGS
jgi:hypothetical protein